MFMFNGKINLARVLINAGCVLLAVRSRLLRLRSLWDEIRQRAEEKEGKLQDVLDLAGKFWADMAALLSTLRDSQDIVKDLEDPGVDPSLIKQQIEAAEVSLTEQVVHTFNPKLRLVKHYSTCRKGN